MKAPAIDLKSFIFAFALWSMFNLRWNCERKNDWRLIMGISSSSICIDSRLSAVCWRQSFSRHSLSKQPKPLDILQYIRFSICRIKNEVILLNISAIAQVFRITTAIARRTWHCVTESASYLHSLHSTGFEQLDKQMNHLTVQRKSYKNWYKSLWPAYCSRIESTQDEIRSTRRDFTLR